MPAIKYSETRTASTTTWYSETVEAQSSQEFISRATLTKSLIEQGVILFSVSAIDQFNREAVITVNDEVAFLQAHGANTIAEVIANTNPDAVAYNAANGITANAVIE